MHKHYFLVGTFLGLLSLSACPADKSAESAPAAQSDEAKGTLKGIYTMLIAYYAETDVFQADLDFGLGKGHKKGPKFEDEHFVYTVKVSKSGFSATAKSKPDLGLGEMTIAFENGSPTNGRIQVVKAAKTR